VPGDDPLDARLDPGQQVGELLVVDERLRALTLHHLDQLRAGEHRVEVERRGADLGRRQRRLEEAAVVARHHPDPVAGADTERLEGVGERVGALLQPLPGQRAAFVEDRDLVRVLDRGHGDPRRGRSAPAQEGGTDPQRLVRTHRSDDPRAPQHPTLEEKVRHGRPHVRLPRTSHRSVNNIGRAARRPSRCRTDARRTALFAAGPAVLGASWERFAGKSRETSRFRPEPHTSVTLLQHPQVDGPKSPLYLDFSAHQHFGSDGMRTKHEEPARKCGVRGIPLTSPATASHFSIVFIPRPSQSSSTCATAIAAMPSPRPIQPIPSLVVALMLTLAEVASPRIVSIWGL